MTKITHILEAEGLLSGIDGVVFDLDDTLYSEKDYVYSGYRAADPEHAEELWQAFLEGRPAFDAVIPQRKAEALRIYRSHEPDIALYPGVREMLLRIRKAGKRLGLITDGRPEGQWAKIRALGLNELFHEIIVTDELGGAEYRKPCEKAFLLMQERLLVPFEKMVYIGDNLRKDFIAPEKLGMRSVYFDNSDGLYRIEG